MLGKSRSPAARAIRAIANPGHHCTCIRAILFGQQRVSNALDRLRKKYQKQNRWLAQVDDCAALLSSRRRTRWTSPSTSNPAPAVDIVTEGFHISRGVLKRNVPVYEENALDDDLLNEGRRNLLNYLQTRGYFDAKVDGEEETPTAGKEMRVIYDIDAGSRHKLVKVDISGNRYFEHPRPTQSHAGAAGGQGLVPRPYDQGLLNDDVRSLGIFTAPTVLSKSRSPATWPITMEGRRINSRSACRSKRVRRRWARLADRGQHEQLDSPFPVAEYGAQDEPFSESLIADDRDIILNHYFNDGFPDATFEATAKPVAGQAESHGRDLHDQRGRTGFGGSGAGFRAGIYAAICGAARTTDATLATR